MPTKSYKQHRICPCGYRTFNPGNWCVHKKCCKQSQSPSENGELVSVLKEQLATKDEQLASKNQQIAAKDEQIRELINVAKRPRSTITTNHRYVVEQHINVFGKESISHITPEQIHRILTDPENAVARFVKLKHREPSNANVRCPNVNRAIYQVVVGGKGEDKEWENRSRGDVLEKIYDENCCILESEATEEDHTPFLEHQDLVRASVEGEDGGRRYKQQLDKIHNIIIS
jgi:hypothetical protein